MKVRFLAAAALALLLPPALAEEPAPAPAPKSGEKPPPPVPVQETLHGLRVDVLVPPGEKPAEGWSLLLFLHSSTGNGKQSVEKLASLAERGFVLAGPWAKTGEWTAPEMDQVRAVARDLIERHGVPRERRHVAGLWTGAGLLPDVAFDEDLGFRTCTWIDGTWAGGSVPKWAKEELNGLFLWGRDEGASRVDRYRKSVSLLADRVRLAVGRGEPLEGLGRSRSDEPVLPEGLLPFWTHFLESMEGRFTPGRDLSFDWREDLAAAREEMAARKTGGVAYVWSAEPGTEEWEETRALQNVLFFDRHVRHFVEQLVAVRLEKGKAKELLAEAKVERTPALVVFKKGGKEILKALSGPVSEKALLPPLRAASPDPELPR